MSFIPLVTQNSTYFPAGVRAKFRSNRSLATVADPPVRRYGGLKDQDRIFTNLYCRHDHGIKGALVSLIITLQ